MKMEAQPLQTISGEGGKDKAGKMPVKEEKGEVEGGSQPSIKVGLEIGGGSRQSSVIKPVFTAAQLHELQKQAIVLRYIAAGLPVPHHLVAPIWKSVVSSSRSEYCPVMHKQYSSWLTHQGFDYRGMMDLEPGRCRRTDGRKWRCSKDIVPDQKYCERHMHRGRKCSRKLVESSQLSSIYSENDDLDNSKTLSFHHLMTPSSSQAPTMTSCTTDYNGNHKKVIDSNISPVSAVGTKISSDIHKSICNSDTDEENLSQFEKHESNNFLNGNYITGRGNMNFGGCVAPGKDFSPKSVLQGLGHVGLPSYRSETEFGTGRCWRTDGKKWRCKKDPLPGQKYCSKHMNRGAKKKQVGGPSTFCIPYAATTSGSPPCKDKSTCSSSSSSTDTTITDTALQADEYVEFSSGVVA